VLGYGVSMPDGLMSVTAIGAPSCSSSMRRPSVKAFTACLVAEYCVCRIMARSESTEPTLMIAPPLGMRWRAATSEPLTTPQ
jgi:hypothetical protein